MLTPDPTTSLSVWSRADTSGRQTEEGFFIFKEAELGIDPEAGGTPLCPFDCDCCEWSVLLVDHKLELLAVYRIDMTGF